MNQQGDSTPSLTPRFPLPSKNTARLITAAEVQRPHRGWHSRGYLPHWDHPGTIQSVIFRLSDSLPIGVQIRMMAEVTSPKAVTVEEAVRQLQKLDKTLDLGHGACWLKNPAIARLIEEALIHFDPDRYRLLAWCVMPNHVHVLVELAEGVSMATLVHSWKSYTGNKANRLLNRTGPFWQREYFDRYIRNAEHYRSALNYIEENPVKARLVKLKTEWLWSSARLR